MSLSEKSNLDKDVDTKLLEVAENNQFQNEVKPKKNTLDKILKWRGFFYATLCGLSYAICNIFIRKCNYFNSSEIAFIRFLIQFITVLPLALKNNYNIFGEKNQRLRLSLRSIIGTLSLLSIYLSITLLNPSDACALVNSYVIFVTLFARIFLKEKLTIVHLTALVITMTGIVLISQPEFLFHKHVSNIINASNQSLFNASIQSEIEAELANFEYLKIIGVCSALFGSLAYTAVSLITKSLANVKAHVSVVCIYASYYGLPASLLISIVLELMGVNKRLSFSFENSATVNLLLSDLFFASISSFLGISAQILMNLAMQLESHQKLAF
jgi:drug/metabolite transporter (DMT)-like permease